MRTLTRLSTALLFFAALLAFAPEAKADGVAIVTSGGTSSNGFVLAGQNFTLNLLLNNGPIRGPFRAGDAISLGSFNLGMDLRAASGGSVVNGITYSPVGFLGELRIGAPAVIPLGNTPGTITLVVPFTLSGHLQVCPSSNVFSGCAPGFVFDSQVLGHGIATATLIGILDSSGRLVYDITSVRYEIQAPVPEPATVVLLGTALAALGAGARRRRKAAGSGS